MSDTTRRQRIFPSLRYRDTAAALRFLVDAFGFTSENVYEHEGRIVHAELSYEGEMIGFGAVGAGDPMFDLTPVGVYVVVDDVDAHHARAVAAGADVVMELTDQDYGSREYAVRDPEGNIWSFGTYEPTPSS